MNTKNTLLVLALTSVLVACGSSSSQGSTPPKDKPHAGNTGGENTGGGNTGNGSTDNGVAEVEGIVLTGDDGEPMLYYGVKSDNLNSITIKGVTMNLLPEGYTDNGFYVEKFGSGEGKKIVSGNKYKYTRFGVNDCDYCGDEDTEFGVFAQGKVTKDMPTTGQATYAGDAIGGFAAEGGEFSTGTSYVRVNFGNKEVVGKLGQWKNPHMPTLNFNAKISGSKFVGTGVKGGFFGPQAAEMGGAVNTKHKGVETGATFGAIKQ